MKDKWLRLIGVPALVLLIPYLGEDTLKPISMERFLFETVKHFIYVVFYWEAFRIVILILRQKYPHHKDTGRRIGLQTIFFFLLICLGAILITFISQNLPRDTVQNFASEYIEIAVRSMLLGALINIIYECVYLTDLYKKSFYESERLKKEGLKAQYELLRDQISPHFLFNSLNTLITIVPEDPTLAVQYIQTLSNVYRQILSTSEKKIASLKTEIIFLKDYIYLYKMRFGDNLHVEYKIPDDLSGLLVATFAMQMLVENALKHNIISERHPLNILISVEKDHIVIENNLQLRTSGVESTNVGLKNIISRYKLLTDKPVTVRRTADRFVVFLPFLVEQKKHETDMLKSVTKTLYNDAYA